MFREGHHEEGRPVRKGRRKGVESIDVILDRWLRKHRVRDRLDRDGLFQRWSEVVGGAVAEHTRIVDVSGGVLVIEVDSAPLLHELSTYYRTEILTSLRGVDGFPNVSDIRFRAGTFER